MRGACLNQHEVATGMATHGMHRSGVAVVVHSCSFLQGTSTVAAAEGHGAPGGLCLEVYQQAIPTNGAPGLACQEFVASLVSQYEDIAVAHKFVSPPPTL